MRRVGRLLLWLSLCLSLRMGVAVVPPAGGRPIAADDTFGVHELRQYPFPQSDDLGTRRFNERACKRQRTSQRQISERRTRASATNVPT